MFSVADIALNESQEAQFVVLLDAPRPEEVQVEYATRDGSATQNVFFFPNDYKYDEATLTFAPGETSKPLTVDVVDDSKHEATESFSLEISDPAVDGDVLHTATATITDDDEFRMESAFAHSNRWVRVLLNAVPRSESVLLEGENFLSPAAPPELDVQTALHPAHEEYLTLQVAPTIPAANYTVAAQGIDAAASGAEIDPADTIQLQGYPNHVLINEVAPNVADGDRVELRVQRSGNTSGMTLVEDSSSTRLTIATLPDRSVSEGEIIVIHADAFPEDGVFTETTGPNQCLNALCYPGAWDVVGAEHIPHSSRVLKLVRNGTQIVDAVPFANTNNTAPANFITQLESLYTAFQWEGSCPSGCTLAQAQARAVDWSTVGSTLTTNTVRRIRSADWNTASQEWAVGANSLGAANP